MVADYLLADTNARSAALDPSRSFIVQAPAGSGKTELLIQRYLTLLTVVDDPEEIVAITFTRKAAQEMRHRVLAALLDARSESPITEAYQRTTRQVAMLVLDRDKTLQWHLVSSPRRLRILTMDAFNASIVRSLPISSGFGGISRTVADTEMQSIYKKAAFGTLEWLTEKEAPGNSVRTVLQHFDANVPLYVDYLAAMLQAREQWIPLLGSGAATPVNLHAARSALEQGIQHLISEHLARVRRLLPAALDGELIDLARYAAENLAAEGKPAAELRKVGDDGMLPDTKPGDTPGWRAIADLLLTQSGTVRRTVNKNDGFPPGDRGQKKRITDLLNDLRIETSLAPELHRARFLPAPSYSDDQWNVLVALFQVLPVAVTELRRLFGTSSVCDHAEVSISASAAMRIENEARDEAGEALLMLDYRIRHLLVDELQDTSVSQYRFLEQLTEGWVTGDGRTFFGVGDPMQSIYRFRDAEVAQFVLAREQGIGHLRPENLVLRKNFRSGEKLVSWFNETFSTTMPTQDDLAAGAIAYSPSIPIEEKAGTGSLHVHPLIDVDAAAEAHYGADLIAQCLLENQEESVAVLVRSRTQLQDLLPELRRRGIAYHAVDIDRLTDLPEIIDLLALTRALCHDSDRIAWLALLHGPLVGIGWRDILSLVRENRRKSIREMFAEEKNLSRLSEDAQHRLNIFSAVIDRHSFGFSTESLRDRVERCWYALGGPATLRDSGELANAYRYLGLLGRLETAGNLQEVSELEALLDQERVDSNPGPDCRLQIMTMHKSKGLQFDHVLLLGLGRGSRGNDKALLNWLAIPDKHSTRYVMSPVGSRKEADSDPLHHYIGLIEKDKQQHELDRLLYVGCTRARKTLTLVGEVSTTSKGDLGGPTAGSLLEKLWPSLQKTFEDTFALGSVTASVEPEAAKETQVAPVCRRFVVPWEAKPAEDLPGRHHIGETDFEHEVEYYWVGSLARYAGIVVHRWLQHFSSSGKLPSQSDLARMDRTTARWVSNLGVGENDVDPVCRRVREALDGVLNDAKGRWILSGEGRSELALSGIWRGEIRSVIIDRVRIDDENQHWIIDYKTSAHEGGDLAGFLEQEAQRYGQQLEKYAALYAAAYNVPVRTALYFPLFQHFQEI